MSEEIETKKCKQCEVLKNKLKFHGKMCLDCFNLNRRRPPKEIILIKTCKYCKIVNIKDFFYGQVCLNCKTIKNQEYYQNNKEKVILASAQYAKNNPEKIKISRKKYKDKNREKVRLAARIYFHNNKEKYRVHNKKNRGKYKKNRRKKDPAFKLRELFSSVIRAALKRNYGSKKGSSFLKKITYSINELKIHLESQFEPWMTWENWGSYKGKTWDDNDQSTWVWNIDHIIPQSKFPYSSMDDENFKKCWALDNLRPLSAKENYIKGDRII